MIKFEIILLALFATALTPAFGVDCPETDVAFDYPFDNVPNVASWEDCGGICALVTNCNYWTWSKEENGQDDHNYCYLYESAAGLNYNPPYISGERGCPEDQA